MADELMQYTLDYDDGQGHGPVRVVLHAPKDTSDDDLKAAAHDYLTTNAPQRDYPPAIVDRPDGPRAPDLNLHSQKALDEATARADAAVAKLGPKPRTGGTGVAGLDDMLSNWSEFGIGAVQAPYNAAAFITDPLLRPFVGDKAVEDVRAQRENLIDAASRNLVPHPSPIAREIGQIAGTLPVAELRAPAAVSAMLPRLAPIAERGVQGALMGAGVRDQDASAGSSAAGGALANVVLPPAAGLVARKLAGTRAGKAVAAKASPLLHSVGDTVARWTGAEAPVTDAAALTKPQETYQLGQKYGVDMMPADVGGRFTKGLTAGTSQTLLGGPAVQAGARRAQSQLGDAVSKVAGDTGLVLEPVDAGNLAKQGAQTVIRQTSERGQQLYNRVEAPMGDTPIAPVKTVEALDKAIAEAAKKNNPQDPVLKKLIQLREQVAGDEVPEGLTYPGMRGVISDTKSAHRTEELRNTNAQRVLKGITKAMDEDVIAALDAKAPGLPSQYERANSFWRDRVETIDDVFDPLVSKDASGESVVSKLNTMFQGKGKGGAMLAGRLLDELPLADARNLRATVIDNLGKAKPSAQDETGGVFSSETFLTNWSKITLRGRKFLTNRDPELGKSLNELAALAARMRESNELANKSSTGRAVNVGRQIERIGAAGSALFGAHEAGATGTLLGVAGVAALEGLTGAALSSQPLVRLLVRAGSIRTPGAAEQWARSMASLAARSPELRDDIAHVLHRTHGTPAPSDSPVPMADDKPANPYADLDEKALRELAGEVGAETADTSVGGGAALPLDNPNLLPETVELAPRVLHQESGGDPNAHNDRSGADGLMQVMPATGGRPGYGIAPLKDHSAAENARFGVDYLDAMLRNHGAHKVLGLMAYNWGPGSVDKWLKGGRHLSEVPLETRHYVNAILRDDVFPTESPSQ